MVAGKFISFEGGEGTGKSTQVSILGRRLRDAGHSVLETREPGGTDEAERVRELLVSGGTDRWSPQAEALLNYAARDHHLHTKIRPALAAGIWVISDRYMDSTRAYQGVAGGVSADLIEALENAVIGDTVPDLTFVMDLDPHSGLQRAAARSKTSKSTEDRFEKKERRFHDVLRAAFLDIADRNQSRCLVVDAAKPCTELADEIWQSVVSRLSP